jgi:hypothetical protein
MHLDLSDEETAALVRELRDIVGGDKFPLSPRIRTLRAILGKLRPEPVREPLPRPKVYAPPKADSQVEHVFARQKGPMGLFIRTIGLARATTKIGLAKLAMIKACWPILLSRWRFSARISAR